MILTIPGKYMHALADITVMRSLGVVMMSGALVLAGAPALAQHKIAEDQQGSQQNQGTVSDQNPYETRIFYLKHQNASDKTINTIYGLKTRPGIVTILQNMMGMKSGIDDNASKVSISGQDKTIVITDTPHAMRTYEALISAMDNASVKFEIETFVFDLDIGKARKLGLLKNDSLENVANLFQTKFLDVSFGSHSNGTAIDSHDSASPDKNLSALMSVTTRLTLSAPRIITADSEPALFKNTTDIETILDNDGVALKFVRPVGFALQATPRMKIADGKNIVIVDYVISDARMGENTDDGPIISKAELSGTANIAEGQAFYLVMDPHRERMTPGVSRNNSNTAKVQQYRRVIIMRAKKVAETKNASGEAIGTNPKNKDAKPS